MPPGHVRRKRCRVDQETPGAAPGAYSRHCANEALIHVRFGPAGANGKGLGGNVEGVDPRESRQFAPQQKQRR